MADEQKENVSIILSKAKTKGTLDGLKHTDISKVLEHMKPQIAQALPKHLTADRMIQLCTTLISRNPKLAKCTTQSLIGAVMQASLLGFKPIQATGECYFIPYENRKAGTIECQFQIGYKGYMSLARNSGQIETLYAEVVYKDDYFDYELGLNRNLVHKPNLSVEPDYNNITYAYAVVRFKDGGFNFVILTKKQIEKLRLRNPMFINNPKLSGAWLSDYDEMAQAKALKKLKKYLPLSEEQLLTAIDSDEGIIKPEHFAKDGTGLNLELIEEIHPQLEEGMQQTESKTEQPKETSEPKTRRGRAAKTEEPEEPKHEQLNITNDED